MAKKTLTTRLEAVADHAEYQAQRGIGVRIIAKDAYMDGRRSTRRDVAELRRLLRELEWGNSLGSHWCHICWRHREQGHAKDCRLAKALKGRARSVMPDDGWRDVLVSELRLSHDAIADCVRLGVLTVGDAWYQGHQIKSWSLPVNGLEVWVAANHFRLGWQAKANQDGECDD
jgi:hypothetical protein